jgi:DNA-binding response OmpR family regulator
MKILVAEDDQFLIKVYQAKLVKEGFEVQLAHDGEEAEKILQTFVPQVILLDLMMPKKDGFQVLSDIKANDVLKSIPVIVTSNLSQPEDKQKALNLGAVEYIVKSDIPIQMIVDKLKHYAV